MKSLKLLLLSSTITLFSALLIQPVIAKPTMALHYVNIDNAQSLHAVKASSMSFKLGALPSNPINNLLKQHTNQLTLTTKRIASEQLSRNQYNAVNNGNGFFETAMVFNDKMQQFFSYFETHDNGFIKPANALPKINNQIKEKNQHNECNS
tara:strand:+ start:137 stop:589 length:453 start_codon:yes stop_codon:yes gene_type:complete